MPVFAFGQTRAFHWYKFGPPIVPQWLAETIARRIGALQPAKLLAWQKGTVKLLIVFMYAAVHSALLTACREAYDLARGNAVPGFLPIMVWGRWGLPMPFRVRGALLQPAALTSALV